MSEAEQVHAKYLLQPGAFVGRFGATSDFLRGLDSYIGLPNPNVLQAMRNEHMFSADSLDCFAVGNGGAIYRPAEEFQFVANPDPQGTYPGTSGIAGKSAAGGGKRTLEHLDKFLQHSNCQLAGLRLEEVAALRLYTGPMFVKYNAVLRKFPAHEVTQLRGNRYVTTIHAIVSGIIKLSQIMRLPPGRKVYRGLGGMLLPDEFWQEDAFGCRGGVEYGMLSTTMDVAVALEYSSCPGSASGDTRATLFEIELGQINRGAQLGWLSQYPCEEEVLVPPLSNLEVVGDVEVRRVPIGADLVEVLCVPLRLSVNLRSKTIEEMIENRKLLHMATLDNLILETRREIESLLDDPQQVDRACADLLDLQARMAAEPGECYNDDEFFKTAQRDMMDLRVGSVAKQVTLQTARRKLLGDGLDRLRRKAEAPAMLLALAGTQAGTEAHRDCARDEELNTRLLREAELGAVIADKEARALDAMRDALVAEIRSIRGALTESPLVSSLLAVEALLYETLLPEAGVPVDRARLVMLNDTARSSHQILFRMCKQGCAHEDAITAATLLLDGAVPDPGHMYSDKESVKDWVNSDIPGLDLILNRVDMLGWWGEKGPEGERYAQQLRSFAGRTSRDILDNDAAPGLFAVMKRHAAMLGAALSERRGDGQQMQVTPQASRGGLANETIRALDRFVAQVAVLEAEEGAAPPGGAASAQGKRLHLRVLVVTLQHLVSSRSLLLKLPEFHRLYTLEQRLRHGLGGDGSGGSLSIQTTLLESLQAAPTRLFAEAGTLERITGAIDVLVAVAAEDSRPWISSFDLQAVTATPPNRMFLNLYDDLGSWDAEKKLHASLGSKLGASEAKEAVQAYLDAAKVINDLYGFEKSGLRGTCAHTMWLSMSMLDEARWAKEYQWLLNLYSSQVQGRSGEAGAAAGDALLSRESVYRALELLALALGRNGVGGRQSVRDFHFRDARIGTGGLTVHCLHEGRAGVPPLSSSLRPALLREVCWFGALCCFTATADTFSIAPFARSNGAATVFFETLTPLQMCLLAGVLAGSQSQVAVLLGKGAEEKEAMGLKHMWPDARGRLALQGQGQGVRLRKDYLELLASLFLLPQSLTFNGRRLAATEIDFREAGACSSDAFSILLNRLQIALYSTKAQKLSLDETTFKGKGAMEALAGCVRGLADLSLVGCEFTSDKNDKGGEREVLGLLKGAFSSLRALDVRSVAIDERAAARLAEALESNTHLATLTIGDHRTFHVPGEKESYKVSAAALSVLFHQASQTWGVSLRSLSLRRCRFGAAGCKMVATALLSCPMLAQLNLDNNRLCDEGCAELSNGLFTRLAHLHDLSLAKNAITGATLKIGQAMRTLTVGGNPLSASCLDGLLASARLESLAVGGVGRGREGSGGVAFDQIAAALSLHQCRRAGGAGLTLEMTSPTDPGNMAAFARALTAPEACVESLCVARMLKEESGGRRASAAAHAAWVEFTNVLADASATSSAPQRLASLHLSILAEEGNGVVRRCLAIKGLRSLKLDLNVKANSASFVSSPNILDFGSLPVEVGGCLTNLAISAAGLGADAVALLCDALIHHPSRLLRLSLSQNYFGDAGVRAVARFVRSSAGSALATLDLSGVDMTDPGCIDLCSALAQTQVAERLDISNNKFGNSSAAAIANVVSRCRALRHLCLGHTELSGPGVQPIAAAIERHERIESVAYDEAAFGKEAAAAMLRAERIAPRLRLEKRK